MNLTVEDRPKITEMRNYTLDKMKAAGLIEKGWEFKWMFSRRILGRCSIKSKTIELSSVLVQLNEIEVIRDVVLHEIAHALDWIVNRECGHGKSWKLMCVAIGATPERLINHPKLIMPPPLRKHIYKATCCDKHYVRKMPPKYGYRYYCPLCRSTLVYKLEKNNDYPFPRNA